MKAGWVLSSLAALAAGIAGMAASQRHAPEPLAGPVAPMTTVEHSGFSAVLPVRRTLGKARIDPFAPRDWTPRAPAVPVQAAPEPPPAPSMPPNPYRFAGTVHYAGSLKAVFIRDDKAHVVPPGETLDGGYKLLSVARDGVTLAYLPLGIEERVALAPEPIRTTTAAPSPFPPGSPLAAASAQETLVRPAAQAQPAAMQPPAATATAR